MNCNTLIIKLDYDVDTRYSSLDSPFFFSELDIHVYKNLIISQLWVKFCLDTNKLVIQYFMIIATTISKKNLYEPFEQ